MYKNIMKNWFNKHVICQYIFFYLPCLLCVIYLGLTFLVLSDVVTSLSKNDSIVKLLQSGDHLIEVKTFDVSDNMATYRVDLNDETVTYNVNVGDTLFEAYYDVIFEEWHLTKDDKLDVFRPQLSFIQGIKQSDDGHVTEVTINGNDYTVRNNETQYIKVVRSDNGFDIYLDDKTVDTVEGIDGFYMTDNEVEYNSDIVVTKQASDYVISSLVESDKIYYDEVNGVIIRGIVKTMWLNILFSNNFFVIWLMLFMFSVYVTIEQDKGLKALTKYTTMTYGAVNIAMIFMCMTTQLMFY